MHHRQGELGTIPATKTEKTCSSVIWGKIRALSHRQILPALTLISNNTLHTNPTTSNILRQHFAKQSSGKYNNPTFSAYQATQDAHPPHFERDSKQWYNQKFTIDKLHRALHSSSSNHLVPIPSPSVSYTNSPHSN
jgi:hypothetical protein